MRVTSRDEIFGCSPTLIFVAGSGGFVHEEGSSGREDFRPVVWEQISGPEPALAPDPHPLSFLPPGVAPWSGSKKSPPVPPAAPR